MHLGSVGVSRNGGRTAKGWNIAICMLLAGVLGLCLMLWITPPVHADDSAGLGITATDDITDTQNLLGSNVSEITDAINQTKKETGVTVRLVYLDSFNAKGKPDKWVSALLESLNPKPNTVMLAVASNDGNLVVAVSSNSEEWLKKKSTVDALSDAAQKPLMESDPDWAKSATDMMNQISVQKKTSTSSRTIWIGVGGFAGALLLLVVILVVFHILRKKGVIGHRRKGRHSGRHGAVHSCASSGSHTVAQNGHQPAASIVKHIGAVSAKGPVARTVLGKAPGHLKGGALTHLNPAFIFGNTHAGRRKTASASRGDLPGEGGAIDPFLSVLPHLCLNGHTVEFVNAAAYLQRRHPIVPQDIFNALGSFLIKMLIEGELPRHLFQDACCCAEMFFHHFPHLRCAQLRCLFHQVTVIILVYGVPHLSHTAAAVGKLLGKVRALHLAPLLQHNRKTGKILQSLLLVLAPTHRAHPAARADRLRGFIIYPLQVRGAHRGKLFRNFIHRGIYVGQRFRGVSQPHHNIAPQRASAQSILPHAEHLGEAAAFR